MWEWSRCIYADYGILHICNGSCYISVVVDIFQMLTYFFVIVDKCQQSLYNRQELLTKVLAKQVDNYIKDI